MCFSLIWPVKITVKSDISSVLCPIDGLHCEQWIKFTVDNVKYKSRRIDTVDDFYLELKTSTNIIKAYSHLMEPNRLEKSSMVRKNQVEGPFTANFEIGVSQLGVSPEANEIRKMFTTINPRMILKIGLRNKWFISKKLKFGNRGQ